MGRGDLVTATLDTDRHPLTDVAYQISCRERLDTDGALVLNGLVPASIIDEIVADAAPRIDEAFFADSTHNVYLTDPDPTLADDHAFNRQVVSSKGLIADDQVPPDSPLRTIYADSDLRGFLCAVLDILSSYEKCISLEWTFLFRIQVFAEPVSKRALIF